jgi:two-component system chemotaxis sensor kinase CheA
MSEPAPRETPGMNPLLASFLGEGRELLDSAVQGLLLMERGEGGAETVNTVFRAVHTLKGTSGLFEVGPLTAMVHAGEDLLDAIRAGRLALDPAMVDQLLIALDQTRTWLDDLDRMGDLPSDAPAISSDRAAALRALFVGGATIAKNAPGGFGLFTDPPDWVAHLPDSERRAAEQAALASGGLLVSIEYRPHEACFFSGEDPPQLVRQVPEMVALAVQQPDTWPPSENFDPFLCALTFCMLSTAPVEELRHLFRYSDTTEIIAFEPQQDEANPIRPAAPLLPPSQISPTGAPANGGAATGDSRPTAPTTLRVDQARIDELMNLIGELIVAKNSLSYLARKAEAGASARELARDIKDQQAVVNRLAEDMQSAVMAIRMLPVSHVFQRFPRLVRDISRQLGKQVTLEMAGEETEADKNMIEALGDPLMHMVRNSLDHGLEPPEERLAAGKPQTGTIRLAAEHVNESIIVTIHDDGRGIDANRVRRKAVERGMMDAASAAALPDSEALRLVFAPGFSTAEQISQLSGRGVGMDVVRSAVERVGGRVDLESQAGAGTTVRVTLPLSMAVTRILTIECAGHFFGIPMGAVVESVRLPPSAIRHIRDREAFVLRGQIIPLFRLAQLLDLPNADAASTETPEDVEVPVLVLRAGAANAGLVIDAFRERMEAIVRPLEGVLTGLPHFIGTTLLGDGRVLLILDVAELI